MNADDFADAERDLADAKKAHEDAQKRFDDLAEQRERQFDQNMERFVRDNALDIVQSALDSRDLRIVNDGTPDMTTMSADDLPRYSGDALVFIGTVRDRKGYPDFGGITYVNASYRDAENIVITVMVPRERFADKIDETFGK